jgi:hypothetical protein
MGSWTQGISKEGSRSVKTSQGQWHLGTIRKQAVCSIPTPTSRRQICEFLGVAGFCQIWRPIFPLLTKPLYKTTKGVGDKKEPLIWKSKQQAFHAIKETLFSAHTLGHLDVKAFLPLCTWEKWHNSWSHDPILRHTTSAGGLSLQKIGFNGKGMTSLLVSSHSHSLLGIREKKLTLGEKITVRVPHSVVAVMKYKGQYWPTMPGWSDTRLCSAKIHK